MENCFFTSDGSYTEFIFHDLRSFQLPIQTQACSSLLFFIKGDNSIIHCLVNCSSNFKIVGFLKLNPTSFRLSLNFITCFKILILIYIVKNTVFTQSNKLYYNHRNLMNFYEISLLSFSLCVRILTEKVSNSALGGMGLSEIVRKKIVEISKLMYDKGLVNPYEGNVSVLEGEQVYITPSGVCKGYLSEDMIVVTDLNGNILEGMYKPSSEIKLHLAVYRLRSDIKSVVHAHPPYSTAYAIANKPIESKAYTEMIAFFGKIPLAKYGRPSTDEISAGVEELIDRHDIILLANHGIVTIGTDIHNAFFKLEAAESMAKTLLLTKLLGGEKELPEAELESLVRLGKTGNN